jgi:hypothetical protein
LIEKQAPKKITWVWELFKTSYKVGDSMSEHITKIKNMITDVQECRLSLTDKLFGLMCGMALKNNWRA